MVGVAVTSHERHHMWWHEAATGGAHELGMERLIHEDFLTLAWVCNHIVAEARPLRPSALCFTRAHHYALFRLSAVLNLLHEPRRIQHLASSRRANRDVRVVDKDMHLAVDNTRRRHRAGGLLLQLPPPRLHLVNAPVANLKLTLLVENDAQLGWVELASCAWILRRAHVDPLRDLIVFVGLERLAGTDQHGRISHDFKGECFVDEVRLLLFRHLRQSMMELRQLSPPVWLVGPLSRCRSATSASALTSTTASTSASALTAAAVPSASASASASSGSSLFRLAVSLVLEEALPKYDTSAEAEQNGDANHPQPAVVFRSLLSLAPPRLDVCDRGLHLDRQLLEAPHRTLEVCGGSIHVTIVEGEIHHHELGTDGILTVPNCETQRLLAGKGNFNQRCENSKGFVLQPRNVVHALANAQVRFPALVVV
eukprot:scaffold120524_cov69-Phaeocystis_antarctica.AAC.3